MKTFFSIFAFFIAAICSAQSPTAFPQTFTITPPDSALMAEMRALDSGGLKPIITKFKGVIPDSSMALARFIAVYLKVNDHFDDDAFDVEAKTLIYYHENGWHNPQSEKINTDNDSDIKYADEIFIYFDKESGENHFLYNTERGFSSLPLKLVIQFLE